MKENSVTTRGSPEFVAFMAAEVQKRPGQCVWYIKYRTLPSGR